MTIKYVICPDYIISKYDGDCHWISADVLMKLHRLNPQECIVADSRRPATYIGRRELIETLPNFYPRYGGEYINRGGI
jgi:hypothetical protein